ncbi:hypothetical protein TW95_gp1115 [Pandoravirus inopinatum]|uniref:DUF5865 domain-containing protein n=1 Tax=Pandoravirus inopinatum TaxID=1605721 RepID=A0A0B5J2Q3_9VIRU|nr:hypothetical protein TW95_gp1115 [Pandoravirus inopinatum]AJF97849.1 hypothetical protein [Pandoravirus inopinatum]
MSTPTAHPTTASAQEPTMSDLLAKLQEVVAALSMTTAPLATPTEPATSVDEPAAPVGASTTTAEVEATAARAKERVPVFKPESAYEAAPRRLTRAHLMAGDYCGTGASHYMTVAQFAERIAALPTDALVAVGAELDAKVLRVYPAYHYYVSHMRHFSTGASCHRHAVVSSPEPVDNAMFNAVKLAGGPIEAGRLARKMAKYAQDAPDAIVLIGKSLAWLPIHYDKAPVVGTPVPVIASNPIYGIDDTHLDPYDRAGVRFALLDTVVAKAKTMAHTFATRDKLDQIASYVATAMADCGLAAFDLFYVPHAGTRAAVSSGAADDYGDLLTLAEFAAAYGGRVITEKQIQRFYRPVAPSDPTVTATPMARILSAKVDNVADLLALLDDPLLCA